MLDNLFQHLPKNIQSVHIMNMSSNITQSLQQRLLVINPKAKIYSSGINGVAIQPYKQGDYNLQEQNKLKENEKSQFKKQSNGLVYDIEDQASNFKESDSSIQNSYLYEEHSNNVHQERKMNEFQQLVKVQLSNLQIQDVASLKARFIKTNECYDINGPNYSIYYDTVSQIYVAIKYTHLDNYIQNQIDAHSYLFNIFQMHIKNFTQILQLKNYLIDSQDYYYITKAPKITMKNFIRNQNQHLEEEKCVKWFIQIVDGLVQLEGIVSQQNLSLDIANLGYDDHSQIVFMDIGNNVNLLEKQMDQFLKQYKQKTIDLAVILFDFKKNDFNYLIFSVGIIFLQILSLDTDIKLIEKQYYSSKIEDLLFISFNQLNDNSMNEFEQNQNIREIDLNADTKQNQQKKTQYSSVLIQLVQDCIFHQDVQKFKSTTINLSYVQSQLNLALSLLK